jgi:hypothetical protein
MATTYGRWERALAQALDAFPQLRHYAKRLYTRINYLVYRERGFRQAVHPKAALCTPAQWAGAEEHTAPLFFGYYDKSPWSPDGQRLLMHELPPGHTGEARVVVFDRARAGRRVVGRTPAWNYQQGSMAQWMPGRQPEERPAVVFNDLEDAHLGARIVPLVEGTASRFVPWPVQAMHPQGTSWIALNYKRLNRLRPEYGYAAPVANFDGAAPLKGDGLWRVETATGTARLVVSLANLCRLHPRPEMEGAEHKVNHAMYAPDGRRLVFMHRWLGPEGKFSRLYVVTTGTGPADASGGKEPWTPRLLLDHRMVSHYTWLDARTLLVWARSADQVDQYYVLDVQTGQAHVLGDGRLGAYGDGHPSLAPGGRWVVTDTYPDKARQRHLLLFDRETGRVLEAGRFLAPLAFDGPVRCDLHPRWSPDGRWLSVDSAHTGVRRSYLVDVSALLTPSNTRNVARVT